MIGASFAVLPMNLDCLLNAYCFRSHQVAASSPLCYSERYGQLERVDRTSDAQEQLATMQKMKSYRNQNMLQIVWRNENVSRIPFYFDGMILMSWMFRPFQIRKMRRLRKDQQKSPSYHAWVIIHTIQNNKVSVSKNLLTPSIICSAEHKI